MNAESVLCHFSSERVHKTETTGLALSEAKYINLSLHFLQQVILALSEQKRTHVPYRNSMMTNILKDSLCGNCLTVMIANLAINRRNIQVSTFNHLFSKSEIQEIGKLIQIILLFLSYSRKRSVLANLLKEFLC